MERNLEDVKTVKSGTNYIILRIPKSLMKKLPDGYFYIDVDIKDVRGGK